TCTWPRTTWAGSSASRAALPRQSAWLCAPPPPATTRKSWSKSTKQKGRKPFFVYPKKPEDTMKHQFLEAGRIVRTHGVRGELVLECWADSPEFVAGVKHLYFDGGKTDAGVVSSRVHKGRLLLKLRGVDTVEQGDALRGKVLYLNREDVRLEEGQVFLQDLIGLKAIDGTTGREYGVLQEVLPTGANDVYRIVDGAGKEYLFPAVKHMIQEISLEEGVIRLLPIPG